MARNESSGNGNRSGAVRDRSPVQNPMNKNGVKRGGKKPVRKILFPTEPSTIGNDKIDRAIEAVMSRRE